jgi:outer membrane protein
MRRLSSSITALAMLAGAGAAQADAQALKLGYVNSQQILATSSEAAAAEQRFNEEMQGYQTEIERLENELTGMQQRLQQQQLTLSPEARANREAQIQQRLTEYQTRTQQLQQQADQRRAELVQPVVDKITAIIETIREEGQYHLILDVAAGSIIAADSTLDLTPEVMRRLSAQAPPAN